jgi:hypothetical protein
VLQERLVDLGQALEDRGVGGDVFAQTYESANDEDAHLHRALSTQHVGSHERTMFGEHPRTESGSPVLLGTGHKL